MENEENQPERSTEENLIGVGQQILGDLEIIGGVLTGDPVTRAEGEFNATVGELHQENSHVIAEAEERDEEIKDK